MARKNGFNQWQSENKKDGTPGRRPVLQGQAPGRSGAAAGGEPVRLALSITSGLRLRGRSLVLQRVLGLIDQHVERRFIPNCNVGQDLAIEIDSGGLEPLYEAAVADACIAAGCIEAHDPETAHLGLLLFPVTVGILPGMLDSLLGVAEELRFAGEVALGVLQYFLATTAGSRGVC